MKQHIHVLNASSRSDTGITEALAESLSWTQGAPGVGFRCLTLADGPAGISTARDSARAAPAVISHVEAHADDPGCAGFIVACFSDPGVIEAREATAKPVVGIGAAGMFSALSLGERFGTIGVSVGSERKVGRQVRQLGLAGVWAGHRALGLDYADLQHPDRLEQALLRAGGELCASDGADVILFAGAGLGHHVGPLSRALNVPVVDPTQAAAGIVLATVQATLPSAVEKETPR